jgi:hypothetical protein
MIELAASPRNRAIFEVHRSTIGKLRLNGPSFARANAHSSLEKHIATVTNGTAGICDDPNADDFRLRQIRQRYRQNELIVAIHTDGAMRNEGRRLRTAAQRES